MEKIVILGGNGRLGRAAATTFHKAGYNVTMVTRNGEAKNLNHDIAVIACDALDVSSVISVTKDCDFVFNGLNPIYTNWAAQALPMARNVIAAAKANGFVHLFPGNVYNYGTAIPPVVDGNTPYLADTKKGKIRVEMEALFKEAAERGTIKSIVLRAGDFFGGTMTGSWFDLALTEKLHKGVFTSPGPMDIPHSWAYLPDLAQTFVKLADVSDELDMWSDFRFKGHCVTNQAMKNSIETALKKKLRTGHIPWTMIGLLAWFVPMMREIHEMSYLWQKPHKLVDPNLEELIGEIPHTPLDRAVHTALRELNLGLDKTKDKERNFEPA